MNKYLLGSLIGLAGAAVTTVLGIAIKKWKSWKSPDIDPIAQNNKWNFKMKIFSKS